MKQELYEKVTAYRIIMSVFKSMLKEQVITQDEYDKISILAAEQCGLKNSTIFR